MKTLLALLIGVGIGFGQQGAQVIISKGPQATPYQKLFFYSGSNLVYVCTALSNPQVNTSLSVTAATVANPGVFTSTAHGFDLSTRPRVRFSAAPSGWSGIVGTWILEPIDANTFYLRSTITGTRLDTSGYTPAWSGTATMTTSAPRTNQYIWQVEWFQYDGSNNLTSTLTAFAPTSTQVKCDDRASGYLEWR